MSRSNELNEGKITTFMKMMIALMMIEDLK